MEPCIIAGVAEICCRHQQWVVVWFEICEQDFPQSRKWGLSRDECRGCSEVLPSRCGFWNLPSRDPIRDPVALTQRNLLPNSGVGAVRAFFLDEPTVRSAPSDRRV